MSDVSTVLQNFIAEARPRRRRSYLEFAEQEMFLARGPRNGMRFRRDFAPWTELALGAMDDPRWRRLFGMGAVQSGKTYQFFVIPTMYHLFEMQETVIVAAPTDESLQKRWNIDIRPVIERTRYRELLPKEGAGSRGGRASDIKFGNGQHLIFMSAGGGDARRSSETSRIVVITETDKMDVAGSESREAAPVYQLEARTSAYGTAARFFGECTVSLEEGFIYEQVSKFGSASRILIRCPHCGGFFYPERKLLVGWQECETEMEVEDKARLACGACGAMLAEGDRQKALRDVRLVHQGQEITPEGAVVGPLPQTHTLGIVWNCGANPMMPISEIAVKEWRAERAATDDLRKELTQFFWVEPWKETPQIGKLSYYFLARHTGEFRFDPVRVLSPKEKPVALPTGPAFWTAQVDVQKRWLYLQVDGWDENLTRWTTLWHTLDIVEGAVPTDPTEDEVCAALDEARDIAWRYNVASMWVDCGYKTEVVKPWCMRQGEGVNGLVGRAQGQYQQMRITGKVQELPPGTPTELVQLRLQDDGSLLWFFEVDRLKDDIYARLFRAQGSPGYHWFARDAANEKRTDAAKGEGSVGYIFRHYMHVKQEFKEVAGRLVRHWVERGRQDFFDLAAYGLAGAYITIAAMRAAQPEEPPQRAKPKKRTAEGLASGVPAIRTEY